MRRATACRGRAAEPSSRASLPRARAHAGRPPAGRNDAAAEPEGEHRVDRDATACRRGSRRASRRLSSSRSRAGSPWRVSSARCCSASRRRRSRDSCSRRSPASSASSSRTSFLTMRVRSRRDAVRAQLPDALDLLAVSVEAGLGLDGALTKLTEHMEGPLVDEFALTLGEIRIGESRQDALKKLTERVPTPEIAAFVRSVIQADQLGISLGPHPARAGRRLAAAPPGRRRGEGDEGADQDAVPDRPLHLPGDVPRHPRPRPHSTSPTTSNDPRHRTRVRHRPARAAQAKQGELEEASARARRVGAYRASPSRYPSSSRRSCPSSERCAPSSRRRSVASSSFATRFSISSKRHERELDADKNVALRQAEVDQTAARISARESELAEREDR